MRRYVHMTLIKFLLLLLLCFSLEAFLGKSNIVQIEPLWLQQKGQIQLNLFLANGYGIQRGSLHKIELYSLDDAHKKTQKIQEKIKQYGHLVQVKKGLSGIISTKNKKYFSSLAPLMFKKIKDIKKDYAVRGRLLYCSFKEAFCSIHNFEILIPRVFQQSVAQ